MPSQSSTVVRRYIVFFSTDWVVSRESDCCWPFARHWKRLRRREEKQTVNNHTSQPQPLSVCQPHAGLMPAWHKPPPSCGVWLLDKYSPIDSHCEPSMLTSCVVKRWFWLYFSNLCQAVWLSIRSIHSLIVCSVCTAFITVVYFYFYFVYFSVLCTLCIFVFYNHCCLVRINKWMNEWIIYFV